MQVSVIDAIVKKAIDDAVEAAAKRPCEACGGEGGDGEGGDLRVLRRRLKAAIKLATGEKSVTLQWSASKTELLIQCARPFQAGVDTPDSAEEPTRYGSAYHELMEIPSIRSEKLMPVAIQLAKKWDLPGAELELVPHVQASKKVLYDWLAGNNDFGLKLDIRQGLKEAAFAVNPWARKARRIELPTVEGHIYQGVTEQEMPMTADLMFPRIAVIDYKSGRDPLDFLTVPETHGQLLTLGLSCAWAPVVNEAWCLGCTSGISRCVRRNGQQWCPGNLGGGIILAALHAERGLPPVMHASLVSREELDEHANRLQVAMHRAGDGSLREGGCCRICPARHDCPAKFGQAVTAAAEVMEEGTNLLARVKSAEITEVTATDIANLHYMLRRFRALEGPADKLVRREYARICPRPDATPEEVAAASGEVGVAPDGKVLVWKEKTVRSLSIKGIYEALGKVAGQELIDELEARGVIKERAQIELHAVDDD